MNRIFNYSMLAAFGFLIIGCSKLSEENSCAGCHLTVNASFDNAYGKATVLDGGKSVYWQPGDEINVFCGTAHGRLVSTNKENSQTATFTGATTGEINPSSGSKLYALYPYQEDASFNDGVITATLPEVQYATEGTFDKQANIMIAESDSNDLMFRHVAGGLRFTLTHAGIRRIEFESNGGEFIAGEFDVSLKDGHPTVAGVGKGSSRVSLEKEDGGEFETGVWYYMSFLPCPLSGGYTVTFSTDKEVAVLVMDKKQEIKRHIYGTVTGIDSDLAWEDLDSFSKLKVLEEEDNSRIFGFADNKYAFCLDYSDESTYTISAGGMSAGMTLYADSELNVNRIVNKDGEYVEFIRNQGGKIDILFYSNELGFVRIRDTDINYYDLRAVPYARTKAGTVMNYTDIALSVLSVIGSMQTTLERTLASAGIANTAWVHSPWVTGILAAAGVGAAYVTGAGEAWLLYEAVLGVANIGKAIVDGIQDFQAERLYGEETVTTVSVVQVTKEKVIVSARIGSIGNSAPYGCCLGAIDGGGLVLTKNWHSSKGVDIGINPNNDTDFLFDNVSSGKGYRAVLYPQEESDIWAGTALDYWKYGEVIRQDYEEEPIKFGKLELISTTKGADDIVSFRIKIPMGTDYAAWYDEWGVIVVDEDGKEYEKFLMHDRYLEDDFEVIVEIPLSEMEKDEKDNTYWPQDRKTRFFVPYCVYHKVRYLDISNRLHYPLSYAEEGCPDGSHPQAIDLGLSVKWATFNIGASKPEEYGGYYAWGETEEKSVYNEVTYKYCTGIDADGDGLYDEIRSYQDIGSVISGTQYDVAHVKWGGSWRMPTETEFEELFNNCTLEWTEQNGVKGRRFTSKKNGNSIFLPAAGYRSGTNLLNVGRYGYSWSSSLDTDHNGSAWYFTFYSNFVYTGSYGGRYFGRSVRPVYGELIAVSSVSLNKNSLEIKPGEIVQLSASVLPANASDKLVTWSSDNSSVATVIAEGLVTGVTPGNAIITVKTVDGGHTAKCSVTVTSNQAVPEMVDLGLSVKWACCNVGASRPEDYGGYYAWGETEEKSVYNEVTYKYCTGIDTDGDGRYDENWSYQDIGNDISGTQYDVAHVKWGGSWRMPTRAEFEELYNNCTSEWTEQNGVKGRRFTSKKNGNSIFLPASGYWDDTRLDDVGNFGNYWSSSLNTDNNYYAWDLYFYSGYVSTSRLNRCNGQSVRPVSE